MTVNELISKYRKKNPNGHFFDPATLRFFGDDLTTATVKTEEIVTKNGLEKVYAYTANQLNAPSQPWWSTHYFNIETLKEVEVI